MSRDRIRSRFLTGGFLLSLAITTVSAQTVFTVYDESSGRTLVHQSPSHLLRLDGGAAGIGLLVLADTDVSAGPGFYWAHVMLRPPEGQTFQPGVYLDAGCPYWTEGRAAGIVVDNDSQRLCLGSDNIWGWIAIRQLELNSAGEIDKLEAVFSQRVGGPERPGWHMTLLHNTKPQSFTLQTGRLSIHGARDQRTYHGDEARFHFHAGPTVGGELFTFVASTPKNRWRLQGRLPSGASLQPGRYATTDYFANRPGWTMSLFKGRDAPEMACQGPGVLDIASVHRDEAGQVTGIRATFEQQCSNRAGERHPHGLVKGEIRFNS